MNSKLNPVFIAFLLVTVNHGLLSKEPVVAVASNFRAAAIALSEQFESDTGQQLVLTFGSTGKQFAQIINGAPYDAWLAADTLHPHRLESMGVGVNGSRFTYAQGKLALVSHVDPALSTLEELLGSQIVRRIAIANPELAPYGRAATEVLEASGIANAIRNNIIYGENVLQALLYVNSGAADAAFVGWSHAIGDIDTNLLHVVQVADSLYEPIEQQALILRDSTIMRAFFEFLRGSKARGIIRERGYELPGGD